MPYKGFKITFFACISGIRQKPKISDSHAEIVFDLHAQMSIFHQFQGKNHMGRQRFTENSANFGWEKSSLQEVLDMPKTNQDLSLFLGSAS